MQIDVGISEKNRGAICAGLKEFLASTYALYLKTQNFHWNVKGSEFYSLHILFEKQYEELAAAVDEIAERIRALGEGVDGTFAGFKKLSHVEESVKSLKASGMLSSLIEAHEIVIRQGRKLAALCDEKGDFATVDLLGRRLGSHEKMAWFLRSQI
ncbi:MAG: DNA starvation/stationary phase protection protein [Verrucomicrobia bacterium]|nr:DNA starvation/stationary phase protection protein [Verrucomicrobiota bacterium]